MASVGLIGFQDSLANRVWRGKGSADGNQGSSCDGTAPQFREPAIEAGSDRAGSRSLGMGLGLLLS